METVVKKNRKNGLAMDWYCNIIAISPEESDYWKMHLIPIGWRILEYSD